MTLNKFIINKTNNQNNSNNQNNQNKYNNIDYLIEMEKYRFNECHGGC